VDECSYSLDVCQACGCAILNGEGCIAISEAGNGSDDTPAPNPPLLANSNDDNGNSGSSGAAAQDEKALESSNNIILSGDGVVAMEDGIFIGAAAMLFVSLFCCGTYFVCKRMTAKENYNNVLHTMGDVNMDIENELNIEKTEIDMEELSTCRNEEVV